MTWPGHALPDDETPTLARAICGMRVSRFTVVHGPGDRLARFPSYQSVRPLTSPEAGWLDILLLWQALAMVPRGEDPTGWGPSVLNQLTRP